MRENKSFFPLNQAHIKIFDLHNYYNCALYNTIIQSCHSLIFQGNQTNGSEPRKAVDRTLTKQE